MAGIRNQLLLVYVLFILHKTVCGAAQCPGSKDGRYPHPTSCRHYLECVHTDTENAQVYTRECPRSNRFFNRFLHKCLWMPSGNCNQQGTGITSSPSAESNEVNGAWAAWTSWSGCSRTCGGGYRSRTRKCNSPLPANGGSYCNDSPSDIGSCNTACCPQASVNGGWGAWTSWSGCSATCDGGTGTRTRECDSPPPSIGCSYCTGSASDTGSCNTASCPPAVNGGWGAWTSWSVCSPTCGGGYRTRTRQCNSPPPSNGGSFCSGSSTNTQSCNTASCPIDGEWGAWTSWSVCRCDNVPRTRTRQCNSPPPSNGGSYCSGSSTDYLSCNTRGCPAEPGPCVSGPSGLICPEQLPTFDVKDTWYDCIECGGDEHCSDIT